MKRLFPTFLAATLLLGVVPGALASGIQQAISVYTTPAVPVAKTCDNLPVIDLGDIESRDYVCGGTPEDYTLWLLVCNGNDSLGIAGMEFGIDYDPIPNSGLDVNAWTLCADLEFPALDWPDAGSGTIITWNAVTNCQDTPSEAFYQNSVMAIAGAIDATYYSPTLFRITPRPVSSRLKVAECSGNEVDLTDVFPPARATIAFCLPGQQVNGCAYGTPVETATWGQVKTLYRGDGN